VWHVSCSWRISGCTPEGASALGLDTGLLWVVWACRGCWAPSAAPWMPVAFRPTLRTWPLSFDSLPGRGDL